LRAQSSIRKSREYITNHPSPFNNDSQIKDPKSEMLYLTLHAKFSASFVLPTPL
jgi:hypothetical protein